MGKDMGKGSPFKYIVDDVGFVPMKEIFRQTNIDDKKATVNLAEGKVGIAINHYNDKGCIHIKNESEVLDLVVSKYSEYVAQDKINDTLVLSYARKDVAELNDSIRNMLVENKKLSLGNNVNINIPKGKDELEHQSKRFAVGEKIVFLRNGQVEDDRQVKNGLFGNITCIEDNIVTVKTHEKENSQEIKVDITKYNNFDYGYATTVHKSQGATVENTLLYVNSKGWNRNLAYVGMSRHKENLDVFVNSDKYSNLETLKRGLASKSNKELNVAEFLERKHPDNFFHKIGQDIGISDKYQVKDNNYLGLGISKDCLNALKKYSEAVVQSTGTMDPKLIKLRAQQAELFFDKFPDIINSNRNSQSSAMTLPQAAERILINKATTEDIQRACKAIGNSMKTIQQSRERSLEESLAKDAGYGLGY